jgi:hypothetical protein
MSDSALDSAIAQVSGAQSGVLVIHAFFDKPTFTVRPREQARGHHRQRARFRSRFGPDVVRVSGLNHRLCRREGVER